MVQNKHMENEPTKVRKNLVHKESFDSSGLKKVSKMPNKMQEVEMEKLVLSFGGVKDELEKGYKLLEKISKEKPSRRLTSKRIPGFGIRPEMEVGCMVTLRGEKAKNLLKRLLASVDNKMKKKRSKKEITNEDLAGMVARGLDDVKVELSSVKLEFRNEFEKAREMMGVIDDRLIKIENHYGRRLDNLEDKTRIIANVLERDLRIKLPKGF